MSLGLSNTCDKALSFNTTGASDRFGKREARNEGKLRVSLPECLNLEK